MSACSRAWLRPLGLDRERQGDADLGPAAGDRVELESAPEALDDRAAEEKAETHAMAGCLGRIEGLADVLENGAAHAAPPVLDGDFEPLTGGRGADDDRRRRGRSVLGVGDQAPKALGDGLGRQAEARARRVDADKNVRLRAHSAHRLGHELGQRDDLDRLIGALADAGGHLVEDRATAGHLLANQADIDESG